MEQSIISHYSRHSANDLVHNICTALEARGKSAENLVPEDLSPFDELHIGGHRATECLLSRLAIAPGHHVLDAGSGLGGAARYAAARYRAQVTGIDLTPSFTQTATQLSRITGMAQQTRFITGSATSLPFPDACFDRVYTIHTAMNIASKTRLYSELYRVLKPGGLCGLYDVMAGSSSTPRFPVPWAGTAAQSHLITPEGLQVILDESGFEITENENRDEFALASLEKLRATTTARAQIIMGPDYPVKINNLIHNIKSGHCTVRQIICNKHA